MSLNGVHQAFQNPFINQRVIELLAFGNEEREEQREIPPFKRGYHQRIPQLFDAAVRAYENLNNVQIENINPQLLMDLYDQTYEGRINNEERYSLQRVINEVELGHTEIADRFKLQSIFIYLNDASHAFQRERVFRMLADGDSCAPTINWMVQEAFRATVGCDAENWILEMVRYGKEQMILAHYEYEVDDENREPEWHFLNKLILSPGQGDYEYLGEEYGLNLEAARADPFNGAGDIDVDEFKNWFDAAYTSEKAIEFLTREMNAHVRTSDELVAFIDALLSDRVLSLQGNRRFSAWEWLEQHGYITLEIHYYRYSGAGEAIEVVDPFERIHLIEEGYMIDERYKISGITDKTSVLLLQQIGILQR